MDDEAAAIIFAKALAILLEPDHGIIVHTGETAVLVFRDGDEQFITCAGADENLLEIPNGTIVPVMKHEIPKEELANFVLPEAGKLH